MSISPCCLEGFQWDGTPSGREAQLAGLDTYISGGGDGSSAAVLVIPDLFGWRFPNIRLLADHYAREAGVTVYVPDVFHGEALDFDLVARGCWDQLDMAGFSERNARDVREPEMVACARALRERHGRVGAVGYCYGGWAVFRLGAREHRPPLVDCIVAAHPSWLTRRDIDEVAVAVQVLAPEIDPVYTDELKAHTLATLPKLGVAFDYQHFPGVAHACMVRGSAEAPGEREAMARGKDAAVGWLRQFLKRT